MILLLFWFREIVRFSIESMVADSWNCLALAPAGVIRKGYPRKHDTQGMRGIFTDDPLELHQNQCPSGSSISACAELSIERQNKNREPESPQ
jgi:hypothetical protein